MIETKNYKKNEIESAGKLAYLSSLDDLQTTTGQLLVNIYWFMRTIETEYNALNNDEENNGYKPKFKNSNSIRRLNDKIDALRETMYCLNESIDEGRYY